MDSLLERLKKVYSIESTFKGCDFFNKKFDPVENNINRIDRFVLTVPIIVGLVSSCILFSRKTNSVKLII